MRVLLICTLALLPVAGFAGEGDRNFARERYEAAVRQAQGTYKFDVQADIAAIRAASARDAEIAVNRLTNERQSVTNQPARIRTESPAEKLTKTVENTTWMFSDDGYVTFLKDGKGVNHKGEAVVWIASDEQTILQQNLRTAELFVWKFSANAESVTRYAFSFRPDSARRPRKSKEVKTGPPAVPEQAPQLNQKIVKFCESRLGKKVGNGMCASFVTTAILDSGGRLWYRNDRGGTDFKWGQQVYFRERNQSETKSKGDLLSILPGDIILFQGSRFSGKGWWLSMGSHVAVIVATKGRGQIYKIMHSNYNGSPKVQASMLDIRTLEKGKVRIFRPQINKKK